jgi:mono/diheme cytochrome c family protein
MPPAMGLERIPRAALAVALVVTVPLISACGVKDKEPDLVAGKQQFVQKCGACHTLNRAGTKGTQGPDLDQAFQQAEKEGFGTSAIRGVVHAQILHPRKNSIMPAGLVEGDAAHDVAAYVATVAAQSGKDSGLLASAVKAAGDGKPIAAEGGNLVIPADPSGQLAFASKQATAPAGDITIEMPNKSGTPHDIVIDGLGKGEVVQNGGVSSFKAKLAAGKTYEFYCSVPGHKAAGMDGKLTVK